MKLLSFLLVIMIVLMIALLVFLAWYEYHNYLSEGLVIDKIFHAGHSSGFAHGTIGTGYGNYTSYNDNSNDKYYLVLENKKNGELVRYQKEVTEEEYKQYSIGDYYKP